MTSPQIVTVTVTVSFCELSFWTSEPEWHRQTDRQTDKRVDSTTLRPIKWGDRKIIRHTELIMMKADDNVLWLPDSYYDRSSLASQAPQLIHTPAASASESSLSTLLNGNFYSQPRVCLILSTKVRHPRQGRAKSGKAVIRSGTVWAQDESVTATWGSRSVYPTFLSGYHLHL